MTIQEILNYAAEGQSPRFVKWLGFVLGWECAYESDGVTIRIENVPGDSGGRTVCGIDEASHPTFPFDSWTAEDVVQAYLKDAWNFLSSLQFPVCEVAANFAVNMGLGNSVRLLQEAIEAQTTITIDGKLGPDTLGSANQVNPYRLAEDIESAADARYRRIAYKNPVDRKFLAGWLARDVSLDHWWKKLSDLEK